MTHVPNSTKMCSSHYHLTWQERLKGWSKSNNLEIFHTLGSLFDKSPNHQQWWCQDQVGLCLAEECPTPALWNFKIQHTLFLLSLHLLLLLHFGIRGGTMRLLLRKSTYMEMSPSVVIIMPKGYKQWCLCWSTPSISSHYLCASRFQCCMHGRFIAPHLKKM